MSKQTNTQYSITPNRILTVGDPVLVLLPQDDDEEPITERAADEYFTASVITIMVPVKIKYHRPTDTVYSFVKPTMDDVERALKSQ